VARIWLDSWKFVRPFKGIFCDDISEFESYHPSHAVGLSQVCSPRNRHAPVVKPCAFRCAMTKLWTAAAPAFRESGDWPRQGLRTRQDRRSRPARRNLERAMRVYAQRDGKRQVPNRRPKPFKGTKFCQLKASSPKERNAAPTDPGRFNC
jgi:hypothetical protein